MIDMTQLLSSQWISSETDSGKTSSKEESDGSPFMMLIAQMLLQSDNEDDSIDLSKDGDEPAVAIEDNAVDLSALTAVEESLAGIEPSVDMKQEVSEAGAPVDELDNAEINDADQMKELLFNPQAESEKSSTTNIDEAENSEQVQTKIAAQPQQKLKAENSDNNTKAEQALIKESGEEKPLDSLVKNDNKASFETMTQLIAGQEKSTQGKAEKISLTEISQQASSSLQINQNQALQQQTGGRVEQASAMMEIPVETSQPEWSEQFNQQIVLMGKQKIDTAQIKLNPPEMGPLDVVIKMDKQNTHLSIQSHSLHVRDMIEQAVPRLREMMADQGLNLADVNVGARQEQTQGQGSERQGYEQLSANGANGQTAENGASLIQEGATVYRTKGLVDYFA